MGGQGQAAQARSAPPWGRSPPLGPKQCQQPAGQNLNIKIRFAQLSRQQEGRAGAKNCHLELHPHRQREEARGADIGGWPQMWLFCRPRWMLVDGSGCTYQQPARAPACPVVPILNTCQQKLSSPTCFKHQTCNYLFTQNTFAAPAFVHFLRRPGQWEEIRGMHQETNVPRAPTMFCELSSGCGAKRRLVRAGAPLGQSLVGMSNGCKAQQRPDTALGDRGHS